MVSKLCDLIADFIEGCFIAALVESFDDPCGNLLHFRFLHAASGERGRADADTGGLERGIDVIRNGVFIDCDACFA